MVTVPETGTSARLGDVRTEHRRDLAGRRRGRRETATLHTEWVVWKREGPGDGSTHAQRSSTRCNAFDSMVTTLQCVGQLQCSSVQCA